jgi:predicted flap endonuclease-1-like 5' DNA nuclease
MLSFSQILTLQTTSPSPGSPMNFEQGPLWMLLVLAVAVGGYGLWHLLTREPKVESEEAPAPVVTTTAVSPAAPAPAPTTEPTTEPTTVQQLVATGESISLDVAVSDNTITITTTTDPTPATPSKKTRTRKAKATPAPAPEPAPTTRKRAGRPKKNSPPAAPPPGDDLTRIEGIGPRIATILNDAGVSSYAALAAATPENMTELLRAANLRAANPSTWPEQATLAASAQWTELEALQETLKGGRRPAAEPVAEAETTS